MIRSLYSGVSGMRGFQTKMDVIGNNIANVNTVGFKKSRVTFQDMLSQTVNSATSGEAEARGGKNPRQIGLGTSVAAINVIHTPGSPITTNVTTDLIINGDGFFAVKSDPDQEGFFLTRAGDFTRDATGNLVTAQGFLVLGPGGDPINIPPEEFQSFSIGPNGVISGVDNAGEIVDEIATIGMVMVNNPAGLNKIGGSLYEVTLNAHPETPEVQALDEIEGTTTEIISGQLEMSNVDLTEEFTDMIITQRGFQANSRIITTSDSMMEEIVNLKR